MKKKISVFISELSDYDIKEYLKRNNMLLLPVGSLEQHGDHAPLGTDTFIPNEISKRVRSNV
ncbi:creatininase family protein [Actinomycetota bacterium]